MHRFFFWLLLIFAPTQLGLHAWPQWSMVLGRRVDYLSPTLFFTDILIALILVFWLRKLPLIPTLIFLLAALVNIYISITPMISLYHWVKISEFALLGYYIVKTKPNLSHIAYCLSLTVLYSSCIAIFQFVLQHSIGGPLWFLGERTFSIDTPGIARVVLAGREMLRAYATFPHPNVLGGYLAVLLPFVFQFSDQKKKLFWATIMLGSIALALTFSRSAWIVAALGIGWVMLKNKYWLLLLFPLFFMFHPMEESVTVRAQLNSAAIAIWKEAPLFGVGLGNFLIMLPEHLPSRTIYFLQPVHNMYLLLLVEVGIIGVIGAIWAIRRRIKFNLTLVALLLLGLVDHYLVTLQQGRLLLTIVIALSYRALRLP